MPPVERRFLRKVNQERAGYVESLEQRPETPCLPTSCPNYPEDAVSQEAVSHPDRPPTGGHEQSPGLSRTGELDRRTLIRSGGVVGAGVVGAVTLAACGGGDVSGKAGGAAGNAAGSAGSGGSVAADAIKASDIPVGGGKVYDAAGIVVTQPKTGEFKAFSAICTHMGCTVAGVADGTITCPCHGSTYDAATGQVTGGPATTPLPVKSVTVTGGTIKVT